MITEGWAVINQIATISEARDAVRSVVAFDRSNDEVMRSIAPEDLQLQILDESWLPPPGDETSLFLALHFDHGHPLFPIGSADLCLYVALYLPAVAKTAVAATRVAAVDGFRVEHGWGSVNQIEHRLSNYAQSHGSSWDWDGDSGHRVSCFARILDALRPPHRLTKFRLHQETIGTRYPPLVMSFKTVKGSRRFMRPAA